MRGKTRNLHKMPGRSARNPSVFGEIVTVDHVYMRDWHLRPGVGGFPDAFTFLDLATECKYCEPVDTKEALETVKVIQHLRGDQTFQRLYSDNHRSIRKACHLLSIMWEGSQPGMHQTNARIERCNGEILAGSRALLVAAGLPSAFWPFACPCYCHLDNTAMRDDGTTSWYRRHGTHFSGERIPFGCGVFFLPANTKYVASKADPRMQWVIFLGSRWEVEW